MAERDWLRAEFGSDRFVEIPIAGRIDAIGQYDLSPQKVMTRIALDLVKEAFEKGFRAGLREGNTELIAATHALAARLTEANKQMEMKCAKADAHIPEFTIWWSKDQS